MLRAWKTNREPCQKKPTQFFKTKVTETQAKNLEANISGSTKPTQNFADERRFVEQKQGLENVATAPRRRLLAENQA